ncbi:MAG TPA: G1 family glutamic endopeptidase [Solirubrobacteraceae bacterium]|nr:G1 family glutamic endopeptidase [Solirubrobacteraceae bacterium]
MESKTRRRASVRLALGAAAALALLTAPPALAAPRTHGDVVHVVKPGLRFHANQSSNWFGYNQGTLEQGSKLFNSITGDWTVPSASAHTAGQDAASSDWIGIGGGCIDAGCTATDATLIQTGTEQDVTSGKAAYSAWWEIIPAPSITISNFTVAPGDHMHASIAEVVPDSDLWTITLKDLTRGESFTQTIPYPSTHTTAEWIEETPLEIGTNAGFSALPNLSNVPFDLATTNGQPANLKASEEMQLVDSNGSVIGSPSAPDSDLDGFAACAWATSCPVPSS